MQLLSVYFKQFLSTSVLNLGISTWYKVEFSKADVITQIITIAEPIIEIFMRRNNVFSFSSLPFFQTLQYSAFFLSFFLSQNYIISSRYTVKGKEWILWLLHFQVKYSTSDITSAFSIHKWFEINPLFNFS